MNNAKVRSAKTTVTVIGTAGTGIIPVIDGRLLAVHIDYEAGTAATTDVSLARQSDDLIPAETLLTISNTSTSGWYRPRAALIDNVGSAITGGYDTYGISGQLVVTVAQSTAAKEITVTVIYEAS